jgi:hypothetical protein
MLISTHTPTGLVRRTSVEQKIYFRFNLKKNSLLLVMTLKKQDAADTKPEMKCFCGWTREFGRY